MAYYLFLWCFSSSDGNTRHEWKGDSSTEKSISLRLGLSICSTERIFYCGHLCCMWWGWKRAGNWQAKKAKSVKHSDNFIPNRGQNSGHLVFCLHGYLKLQTLFSFPRSKQYCWKSHHKSEKEKTSRALTFSVFNNYWSSFKDAQVDSSGQKNYIATGPCCPRLPWQGSLNSFLGTRDTVLKETTFRKKKKKKEKNRG